MVQAVSSSNNNNNISVSKSGTKNTRLNAKFNRVQDYADSFVRNAKQSTPFLAIATGILIASDKKALPDSLSVIVSNNIKNFFLPVLITSSAILSFLENKKPSDEKNNM